MLDTIVFDKYSVVSRGKTSDWFTEYGGKDKQGSQAVTVLAFHPALAPIKKLLPRLEATSKKLAALPPGLHPAWLGTGEASEAAVVVCAATDGEALADRIAASGGMAPEDVIELAYRLGKYLEALHSSHLLQGTFSPQEVVFTGEDGAPVVTVPALADCLDLPKLLASGALPERPGYAPELVAGKPVEARSDIYSLGALLFEALTGKPVPKPDFSPDKTMIVTWLPSRLRRDIPPALDELVATCLHPEADKRYPSLAHFLAAVNDQRPDAAPSPSMIAMEDSLVGQTLGAYRLVERLGQGGMATVYKAYEPALNRHVAIKVLPQFFANDPNFTTRFRREAKAVAKLSHPNIVPIYSYGESSGITYIAMQYVEGGTLKHERGEKMDYQSALRLLLPITRALGYAHQRGIIHRDVKPSNVLIGEGSWPLLADFGLARMAEASSEKLTGTGVGMGTPMYMSPEQGQGVNVDHRSDIYSLGIMLYEFITGDVPFRADTPMAIVIKHMTAPMPMPRSVDPSIPEAVESLILKATAKDSADRFQTAEEMADAMEALLLGVPVTPSARAEKPAEREKSDASAPAAKPSAPSQPAGRKKILRRVLLAILGILGFCLLAVIVMGIFDICPPQGPWPQPPWCEGSPFQFSMGSEPTPSPAPRPSIPFAEYDPFGFILLEDDFDGEMLPDWTFTCHPDTVPWIVETVDGRTVLHSQPPEPGGGGSCIEIGGWNRDDYTVEFNFNLVQTDPASNTQFWVGGRIVPDCPGLPSQYILEFSPLMVSLVEASCEPEGINQVAGTPQPIEPNTWHLLQYMLQGNRVLAWIDGELYVDYTDEDAPITGADGLWLTTYGTTEILLDDLVIYQAVPITTSAASPDSSDDFTQVFFEDDFDGAMLSRWSFTCDPNTTPWIPQEVDGRTVFHSQPPSPPGNVSCAEIQSTTWQDYTTEFSFKFHQPDQFGVNYFSLAGRITHCPPTIQSVQEYAIYVSDSGIQLHKSTCVPARQTMLAEIMRPIDPDSWHLLKYTLMDNRIQVWLDGEPWLDHTDEDDPNTGGSDLWFTTFDSAEILIDDLKVYEAVPGQ